MMGKVTEKTKCNSAFVHDVSLSSSGDYSGFVGQSGNRRRRVKMTNGQKTIKAWST